MDTIQVEPLEATVDVAASQDLVWSLVSDLPRMASWSPQVVKTIQRGSAGVGTTTLNINHSGWKVWPSRSEVIRFEPPREIAFRIKENFAVWSYTLEPLEGGDTRIVQRREAPDGIARVPARVMGLVMGGIDHFNEQIHAGMKQTLQRIKAEVEG